LKAISASGAPPTGVVGVGESPPLLQAKRTNEAATIKILYFLILKQFSKDVIKNKGNILLN
jgi:hypothetical protein